MSRKILGINVYISDIVIDINNMIILNYLCFDFYWFVSYINHGLLNHRLRSTCWDCGTAAYDQMNAEVVQGSVRHKGFLFEGH